MNICSPFFSQTCNCCSSHATVSQVKSEPLCEGNTFRLCEPFRKAEMQATPSHCVPIDMMLFVDTERDLISRFRIFTPFPLKSFAFFSTENYFVMIFSTEPSEEEKFLENEREKSAGSPSHRKKPVSLCTLYLPLTCVDVRRHLKVGKKIVSFNWKHFCGAISK